MAKEIRHVVGIKASPQKILVDQGRSRRLEKNKYVQWKSLDGYGFEGTQLSFTIQKPLVFLRHWGWKKTDFMFDFCSTKWATFMLSLKDYIEKGKGRPFPRDTQVIHADVG